jgi:hypothetical protein
MDIAKLENGNITVGDYKELFPNTSFPVTGPDDNFFTENGCLKVSMFKEHDRATQMLVGCEPYEENGVVYTVTVQARPQQEETIIIDSGNGSDSIPGG